MEQKSRRTWNWAVVALFLSLTACGVDGMFGGSDSAEQTQPANPPMNHHDGILSEDGDGLVSDVNGAIKPTDLVGGGAGTPAVVRHNVAGSKATPMNAGSGGMGGSEAGTNGTAGTDEPVAGTDGSAGTDEPEAGTGGDSGAGGTTEPPQGGTGGTTEPVAGSGGMGGSEAGTGGDSGAGGSGGTGEAGTGPEAGTGGTGEPPLNCVAEECEIPNAIALCTEDDECGIDSCESSFVDCDDSVVNGCEINTDNDVDNCGACDHACNPGATCTNGVCEDPEPLECSTPGRSASFDDLRFVGNANPNIPLVGGGAASNASNVFVSAANYDTAAIAHSDGMNFTLEVLPFEPSPQGQWQHAYGVCATEDGKAYAATADDILGAMIFVRNADGTWSQDLSAPYAILYKDVWCRGNVLFVVAQNVGRATIWKKSGAIWTNTNLPDPTYAGENGFGVNRVWALDENNVFAVGVRMGVTDPSTVPVTTGPVGGVLWFFDGSNWTIMDSPAGASEFMDVHGTSVDDIWIAGKKSSGGGVVYELHSDLTTWTVQADSSHIVYNTVWSTRPGVAVAVGATDETGVNNGAARITYLDQSGAPRTMAVDNQAAGAVKLWGVPGSDQVYFAEVSQPHAGVYSMHCN